MMTLFMCSENKRSPCLTRRAVSKQSWFGELRNLDKLNQNVPQRPDDTRGNVFSGVELSGGLIRSRLQQKHTAADVPEW